MTCWDGLGNLSDGRPFWAGNFSRPDRADVLFHYPGDKNWWLGSHPGPDGEIAWTFAGNTAGFGDLPLGCPTWAGNFSRPDRAEILFHYPGDKNWWLGTHDGNQLAWTFAGNTADFGDLPLGCPTWVGDFNGNGRADVLFHYPGDKNWWLGAHPGPGGETRLDLRRQHRRLRRLACPSSE